MGGPPDSFRSATSTTTIGLRLDQASERILGGARRAGRARREDQRGATWLSKKGRGGRSSLTYVRCACRSTAAGVSCGTWRSSTRRSCRRRRPARRVVQGADALLQHDLHRRATASRIEPATRFDERASSDRPNERYCERKRIHHAVLPLRPLVVRRSRRNRLAPARRWASGCEVSPGKLGNAWWSTAAESALRLRLPVAALSQRLGISERGGHSSDRLLEDAPSTSREVEAREAPRRWCRKGGPAESATFARVRKNFCGSSRARERAAVEPREIATSGGVYFTPAGSPRGRSARSSRFRSSVRMTSASHASPSSKAARAEDAEVPGVIRQRLRQTRHHRARLLALRHDDGGLSPARLNVFDAKPVWTITLWDRRAGRDVRRARIGERRVISPLTTSTSCCAASPRRARAPHGYARCPLDCAASRADARVHSVRALEGGVIEPPVDHGRLDHGAAEPANRPREGHVDGRIDDDPSPGFVDARSSSAIAVTTSGATFTSAGATSHPQRRFAQGANEAPSPRGSAYPASSA